MVWWETSDKEEYFQFIVVILKNPNSIDALYPEKFTYKPDTGFTGIVTISWTPTKAG
eukprot:c42716_g1_i1 orf=2-169(-)